MDSKKREQIEKAVVELGGVFPLMDKDYLYQRFDGRYFADKYWSPTVICTRAEFEQVKAELQNKPSWSDAPEWANWLAQGGNGFWEWHSDKPVIFYNGWDIDEGASLKWDAAGDGKVIGDWRTTLEERPEPNSKPHKNDWHTRGELPPVGELILIKVTPSGTISKGRIHYIDKNHCVWSWRDSDKTMHNRTSNMEFRPLRTERDELMEQAGEVIDGKAWASKDLAIAFIDAGWRPPKQQQGE
jgi:hypothetical protein